MRNVFSNFISMKAITLAKNLNIKYALFSKTLNFRKHKIGFSDIGLPNECAHCKVIFR